VTELNSDNIYLLYRITEFYWDKYFKLCRNLSYRTYGSVWQGFIGTSHFMKQSVSGYPGQVIYKTEWHSPVGTSHFCWLKMNLTAFSGWRLKPWIQSVQHWVNSQHSQYSFRASGYCKAELQFYFCCTNQSGLVQSKESGAVRKGQVLSGDLAPLWTWACEIRLIYTLLFI